MPEQFDIINNQTHEILKKIPRWYIRFGSVILLFVFITVIIITTKINYPTYLNTSGYIKNINSNEKYYFITKIPQKYFTTLKKGTQYKLSLESYPTNKYGDINPIIDSIIPPTNEDNNFTIYSLINNKKSQNTDYDIVLINNLVGKASFTIEKKSLFSQLFK